MSREPRKAVSCRNTSYLWEPGRYRGVCVGVCVCVCVCVCDGKERQAAQQFFHTFSEMQR